jgi:hypothetical protein
MVAVDDKGTNSIISRVAITYRAARGLLSRVGGGASRPCKRRAKWPSGEDRDRNRNRGKRNASHETDNLSTPALPIRRAMGREKREIDR